MLFRCWRSWWDITGFYLHNRGRLTRAESYPERMALFWASNNLWMTAIAGAGEVAPDEAGVAMRALVRGCDDVVAAKGAVVLAGLGGGKPFAGEVGGLEGYTKDGGEGEGGEKDVAGGVVDGGTDEEEDDEDGRGPEEGGNPRHGQAGTRRHPVVHWQAVYRARRRRASKKSVQNTITPRAWWPVSMSA